MSRLYRVTRRLLRRAVRYYFSEIQASGQELIPHSGPLIFAANHPNSIMDTVLLGTQTRRQIRYMARSGLFKNLAARTLFHEFGVIPIYRAEDGGGTSQNADSFEEAYRALEEGGCIGIFPEGRNSLERKIRELKTGTARIALAVEARNGFTLGTRIQPVGLNFEDRDRVHSRVLLRFGEPIEVKGYAEQYHQAPREAVRELTARLQEEMRRLSTHIQDERDHALVADIAAMYGTELQAQLARGEDIAPELYDRLDRPTLPSEKAPRESTDLEARFELEQRIANTVAHYQHQAPARVARVRMDVRRYRDHLAQLKLRDGLLAENPLHRPRHREALKLTLLVVLFGPLAFFGFLNNVLPALLVRAVARRAPDEPIVAIAGFVAGLIAFPLFYALQARALWVHTDLSPWWIALYVLSLPTAGLAFLRWWRRVRVYRDRILFRTFFRTRRNLLDAVERERQSLITTFEDLHASYVREHRLLQGSERGASLPVPRPTEGQEQR
ncbi:hypothetical protein DL240_16255 [Lujinxingia litoralis]|uniref:Phospholipid/glycerol acyltransferase domain-containing protein n=1 Tax=Lujinxingia litoralis TaxID=2211119 RepID=A0A328C4C5_9DELT|nr:lysophospholipid acyltransferase family protein [Lujinxingia litoralis]RAL20588.1 hypothetical protein DL240_16255 [Lujinxingia litoralis]